MNRKKFRRYIFTGLLSGVIGLSIFGGTEIKAAKNVDIDVKTPKKIPTSKITKVWYRPKPNSGEYQWTEVTNDSGPGYSGTQIVAGKGTRYYFSRFAFLADGKFKYQHHTGYHYVKFLGKYAEPQGVAIVGKYMYVQMTFKTHKYTSSKINRRYGRLVRYNLNTLNKYVNKSGSHAKVVTALEKSNKYRYTLNTKKSKRNKLSKSAGKHLSSNNYRIYKAVTLGPKYYTGHGQSFSYNPYNHYLYNAAYDLKKDNGKKHALKFQKISRKSLKPIYTQRLYLRLRKTVWKKFFYIFPYPAKKTDSYLQIRDLTFDKDGNFYFAKILKGRHKYKSSTARGKKYAKGYRPSKKLASSHYKDYGNSQEVFQGKFKSKSGKAIKSIKIKQVVSNAVGTLSQGLAYSSKGNRLFLVYDDAFMSMPLSRINKKITTKQLNFTVLNSSTTRETENMGITSSGRGYLVFNRPAETARSSKRVK